MKLVAAIKMLPTREQAAVLKATLARCNEAATWLAAFGFERQIFRQYDLHKLAYPDLKARGLTAQAAVLTIAKVANAFKVNRKVASVFRPDAAQPYDDRIIRFTKHGTVNLWTIEGRVAVPIVMGEHQARLMAYRKGEVDLCFIRGKWMLAATCDIPETEEFKATDWIGVDLGIVSLLVSSDGHTFSGADVETKRQHHQRRRRILQKIGTRAAKRRLRINSRKQRRYQRHTNHCIAKAVVLEAERTRRGIALENLRGIRARVTARSSQRARLGNWGFGQLGAFLAYKAKRSGVPVAHVDPRNTSQQCSACGYIDKRNRTNQATFLCISCGHSASADLNAATNIRKRMLMAQADVTRPDVLAA